MLVYLKISDWKSGFASSGETLSLSGVEPQLVYSLEDVRSVSRGSQVSQLSPP